MKKQRRRNALPKYTTTCLICGTQMPRTRDGGSTHPDAGDKGKQSDRAPQAGGEVERTWRLIGYDTFAREYYPLPGAYRSRKGAEHAGRERLHYLEAFQPTKTSGGQAGIQDQVWVLPPSGDSYRLTLS